MAGEPAEGDAHAEVVPTPSPAPSTNWVVAGGYLQQAVAFDTSSTLDSDGSGEVSAAKGPVFLKAPSGEAGPCDVHICFGQKHDIYRIYVRSTARVYEIYHSVELPLQSNEYLCTVHCGKASTELLPEIDDRKLPTGQHSVSQAATHVPETSANGGNNNGSNEDGWVEVRIPDSPVIVDAIEIPIEDFDGKGTQPQTLYEATAEISDLTPCMSLTIRLLSLQPKGQVYIEEIYLYADPCVPENRGFDPSTSSGTNPSGSSLLSMLIPGLMQLPRSGNSSALKDKGSSYVHEKNTAEEIRKVNPDITRGGFKEAYITDENSVEGHEQPPIGSGPENSDPSSCKEIPVGSMEKSFHAQSNEFPTRTEKLLEELLCRVGRIETFCSCFEEKMAKPLLSIETRLQKVEQHLEILTQRAKHPKPHGPSSISAPEFACSELDSANRDHDVSETTEQDCISAIPRVVHPNKFGLCPGLFVRAPEFVQDDNAPCCSNATVSEREILSEEKKSSETAKEYEDQDTETDHICDRSLNSERERSAKERTSVFSAPEFSPEDDILCSSNASPPAETNHSKDRLPFTIDMALASALDALLSSTVKSPVCNHPLDPQEASCSNSKSNAPPVTEIERRKGDPSDNMEKNGNTETLAFASGTSPAPIGTDVQSSDCEFVNKVSDGTNENDPSPMGASYKIQNEWPLSEIGSWNLASEAILATNDRQLPLGGTCGAHGNQPPSLFSSTVNKAPVFDGGSFPDSDADEVDQHPSRVGWFGESSTESIADGLAADLPHVSWNDLSSSDSVEVQFPLPSWLTGVGSNSHTETEDLERVTVGSLHSNTASGPSSPNLTSTEMGFEYEGEVVPTTDDINHLFPTAEMLTKRNQMDESLFEDLLREMSNIEVQACDGKDGESETKDEVPTTSQHLAVDQPFINIEGLQYNAFLSDSSTVPATPLVDIAEMVSTIEASTTDTENSYSRKPDEHGFFTGLI